jgi:hypothetical protein
MRYENFIRKLEQARTKYESTVRALIAGVAGKDAAADGAIRKLVKKKVVKRKKLHWTQRPENKAKMLAQLKRATKAKQATLNG